MDLVKCYHQKNDFLLTEQEKIDIYLVK